MCMSSPKMPPPPQLPAQRAAMRQPDRNAARDVAGTRAMDRFRTSSTILTSGQGAMSQGDTERKTLLGQ